MKETGKRILALVMALCLTLALGTTALAAEGTATISAQYVGTVDNTLQAGVVSAGTITVTASNGKFNSESIETNVTATVGDTGVNIGQAEYRSETEVTFAVNSCTPTKSGDITITAKPEAFTEGGPSQEVTAKITVKAAADPTVTASGSLVAGQQGTIELSITGEANTFAGTPAANLFTLTNCNSTNPSQVNGSGQKVTLTVTPTNTQGVTVSIDPQAFTYQPGQSISCDSVSVSAPTVTATASGELTLGKAGGKITVTISDDNDTFKSDLGTNYTGMFTVNVGAATLEVTGVERAEKTATLTVAAPTTKDTVSVKINKKAFTYEAADDVTADSSVTIKAPTGTVSAALEGGELYAGTEVSGQKIKLTANPDLTFGAPVKGNFELVGAGKGSLDFSVSGGDGSDITLELTGTPSASGDITVQVKQAAFKYQPEAATIDATQKINVKAAPEVTMNPTSMVAGNANTVEITIKTEKVNFASAVVANTLKVTGDGFTDITVTNVAPESNKATLTLSKTPTTSGQMKIEIPANAFNPVASAAVTATVEVQAPSGPVTAALSGSPATLTAGVEAGGTTIQLSAAGSTLNFTNNPSKGYFTLENDTGEIGTLAVSGATGSGKTVTLSLTGIPQKQGTFKVKIGQGAFVASPGQDLSATGELTINYPTVTVSPSPDHLVEDDDTVKTIELTATGSVFKNINQSGETGDFTFADYTDIKLASVTATEGSSVATLTFTGTPENSGELTINVQPTAFKYQPAGAVSTTVSITLPSGTLKAALNNGPLSAGTPVTTQTITLTINDSKGLHFKDKESGLQASSFTLVETKPDGLEIADVTYVSQTQVTLTLKGTPTAAGSFKVQAAPEAFKAAPEAVQTTENQLPVQDAPTGSVTAALSGPLYAGTPADGTTVTLTATGLTFASPVREYNFDLTTGSAGMTIADVKLSGGQIVLTLSGTPAAAGTFQVEVANSAFTVYPTAVVSSNNITVGAANIKLALSDNGLQAGKTDMTFKVTPSGGKLIDLANRAAAIDTGADLDGLTLGDMTQNADGSVTVAIMGMPPVAGSITITFQASMFSPAPEGPVSLTVPVAEGEQAAEPETKPGAPGIGFTAPMDELAASVLTPEEQALYEKGAQVLIELVESPDAQVPEADKTIVTAAAGEYTVGEYLDVSLIKTINGVSDPVSETNRAIRVVFTIPTDLQAAGRQFAVIRVHDGKAEFLKTVDSTASTITVESDRFSTYAIVYREAPATATPAPTQTSTATPAPTDSVPDTGDDTALPGWTALLLGCAAALTAAVLTLRRKDRRG